MMIKYISNQSAFKYTSLLNAWLNEKSFERRKRIRTFVPLPGTYRNAVLGISTTQAHKANKHFALYFAK